MSVRPPDGSDKADGAMPPAPRRVQVDERRRLVAAALDVGNPARRSRALPEQADPRVECPIEIDLEEIRVYEGNPRRSANAKFDEIKASIRTSGIRSPLTVTRRPGEKHFIVEAGGNTRLEAIRQLWAETGDVRFRRMTVLFRPWVSETHVLAAHLSENEQRGGMTFWDKACGVMRLEAYLEEQRGHVLSVRELDEAIRALGLPVNIATLAHYRFATDRLQTLGEGIPDLTGLHVKTIQPRLNQLRRYARTHAGMERDAFYEEIAEPVFVGAVIRTRGRIVFSAEEVLQSCEAALARRLGVPAEVLARTLRSMDAPNDAEEPHGPVLDAENANGVADTAGVSAFDGNPLVSARTPAADSTPAASRARASAGLSVLRSRVTDLVEAAGLATRLCVSEGDGLTVTWLGESDGSASGTEGASRNVREILEVVAEVVSHDDGNADADGASRTLDLVEKASSAELLRWLVDAADPVAEAGWRVLLAARDVATARRELKAPRDD
ncbi:MAG: ParB N-terminal domain-containing protein [Planctomycetes bacterium]|nr:ParB N-terminal domain-containing protein [Planctomycetota bacterium]